MPPHVVSVNVGRPRTRPRADRHGRTAIWKEPVPARSPRAA